MMNKFLLACLAIGVGLIASAQAQFLQVQFGATNSPEQNGFSKVVLANGSGKGPMGNNTYAFSDLDSRSCSGTVTLSFTANSEGGRPVAGGCDSRDNGLAPDDNGPYAALYRSNAFTGRNDIRFQLEGLTPMAAYKIKAWSFMRTLGVSNTVIYRAYQTLTGFSADTSTVLGKAVCPRGSAGRLTPVSPADFMVEFTISADTKGRFIFGPSNLNSENIVEPNSKPIINGFSLTLAEPTK